MRQAWAVWLYAAVERTMGRVIGPMALAVFFVPFLLRLPAQWRLGAGYLFLLLGALALLGNTLLVYQRQCLGQGASPFPFCVLAHGISSGTLLFPDAGLLPVLFWILTALAVDYFGPCAAATALAAFVRKRKGRFANRPYIDPR